MEIYIPVNTTQTVNLRKVEAKNPINEPKAAFPAFFTSLWSLISSPIKAPKNGPKIIPNGPKKIPKTSPIIEPFTPYLLPPNFFVPREGNI